MTIHFWNRIALILAVVLLVGCFDGDGSDSSDGDSSGGESGEEVSGGGEVDPPTAVNGELEGRLYFSAPTAFTRFDLATGIQTVLKEDKARAYPSADASEFVTVRDPLSDASGRDEIAIFSRDGHRVTRFEVEESLRGMPKLSPDGERIAVRWWPSTGSDFPRGLAVFTREGDLETVFKEDTGLNSRNIEGWEWLSSDTLVFSHGNELYRASVDEPQTPELLTTLPGSEPRLLELSPDGEHIAFDMKPEEEHTRQVHRVDVDGGNLRQLTDAMIHISSPAWVGDGSRLIVRWGLSHSGGPAPPTPGGCPRLFAIEPDASMTDVSPDRDTPGVIELQKPEDGDLRHVCSFSSHTWRPVPEEPLPSSKGAPFSGDGYNEGLSGRLFHEGPRDFQYVDLHSADLTVLPNTDDGKRWSASWDGEELVYAKRLSSDLDQITFQQLNGSIADHFQIQQFVRGPIRMSSDGQRIAFRWWGSDVPEDGVAVIERSGQHLLQVTAAEEWAWLPDGRLAVAAANLVFMVDSDMSGEMELIAQLPNPVSSLDASPDGSRLAFEMEGHVWTLSVEGEDLTQLTVSERPAMTPSWSPDGKAIALRVDYACPRAFAVPADGQRVYVGEQPVPTTALQLSRWREDPERLRRICAFSPMMWSE